MNIAVLRSGAKLLTKNIARKSVVWSSSLLSNQTNFTRCIATNIPQPQKEEYVLIIS